MNAEEIREILDENYLFEVSYRDGASETTILATQHEITRPSAKPLDGTPVYSFRPLPAKRGIRVCAPQVIELHPVTIDHIPEPLWGDAAASLVEVAKNQPTRIPLTALETLLNGTQYDDDGRSAVLALARFAFAEHDRAPDDLADPIVEFLADSTDAQWVDSGYSADAARCLATLAEHDPIHVIDAIPQLAIAAEKGDRTIRQWTMYAFSKVSAAYPEELFPVLDVLIEALGSEDDNSRVNALSALGHIVSAYPDPAEPLADDLAALLDSDESVVRANATGLLGDLANEHPGTVVGHASAIAERLTDESADARRNASIALLRAGEADPDAIRDEAEHLEAALDDDVTEVRRNACSLIGNAQPVVSTDRLRDLRESDPDELVRDRAGWALERLEDLE